MPGRNPPVETIGNAWSTNVAACSPSEKYQFCGFYRTVNQNIELFLARRNREAGEDWDHPNSTIVQVTGAARTALAGPIVRDVHHYIAVAVSGTTDANMRLHVFAHQWNDLPRYIMSTTPGWSTALTTLAGSTLPNLGNYTRMTYPAPVMLPGGDLWMHYRCTRDGGGSGRADACAWRYTHATNSWSNRTFIWQGILIPGAGPGGTVGSDSDVQDDSNWSPYITWPYIFDHPDGTWTAHVAWVWRTNSYGESADARRNERPGYAYTKNGTNWFAADHTPLTLPLDPLNTDPGGVNAAAGLGVTTDGEGWYNWGSIVADDQNRPHMVVSNNPWYYIRRNEANTAWLRTKHSATLFTGASNHAIPSLAMVRGNVAWLSSMESGTGTTRRAGIIIPATQEVINIGHGTVPGWTPLPDRRLAQTSGVIDVVIPDGKPTSEHTNPNTLEMPHSYTFDPRFKVGQGVPPDEAVMVPLSIDPTGTADTATALTSFFASVPDGSTVRFQPGGLYNVDDGTVDIEDKTGLSIDLNGATIRRTRLVDVDKRWPKNYPWLRITDCTNVTVGEGSISGLNIGDPNVYGAHLDGFTHDGTPGYIEDTPPTPGYEDLVYFPTSDLRWGQHVPGADNINPADPWWGPGVAPFPGAGWYLLATQHDPQNPNQWSRWQEPTMTSVPGTKADHGAYSEALAFEHAVWVEGGSGVTIENLTLTGMGGDYVFCRGATGDGHTIRNISNGRRNGRQGFALISGGPYLIEDCDNTWSRRAWLDLEADQATQTLSNVEVRNNTGCVAHNLFVANQGDGGLNGLYVHDNQIERSSTPLVWIASNPASSGNALRPRSYYRRFNIRIEDNLWESPALPGGQAGQHASGSLPTIVLDNVEGGVVARNTFPRQSGSSGPLVGTRYWPSTDIAIYDNPLGNHNSVFTDQVVGEPDKWAWAASTGYTGYTGVVFAPPTTWRETETESPPALEGFELVLDEDWSSGTVNPARWSVANNSTYGDDGATPPTRSMRYMAANTVVSAANTGGSGNTLKMLTKRETTGTGTGTRYYTAGAISTREVDVYFPRFGRIEIRARIPHGQGLWPAFWTRHFNGGASNWEIDIMEYFHAFYPGQTFGVLHRRTSSGGSTVNNVNPFPRHTPFETPVAEGSQGWHTWAVEVLPVAGQPTHCRYRWELDGVVFTDWIDTNSGYVIGLGGYNGTDLVHDLILQGCQVDGPYVGDPDDPLGYSHQLDACIIGGTAPASCTTTRNGYNIRRAEVATAGGSTSNLVEIDHVRVWRYTG